MTTEKKLAKITEHVAARKAKTAADLAALHGKPAQQSMPALAARVAALEAIVAQLID